MIIPSENERSEGKEKRIGGEIPFSAMKGKCITVSIFGQ